MFDRFAASLEELRRFGGLPRPLEAAGIWDDIWHLEAHNSTAIEGNTLVLREVAALLDHGRAVGAKDLKDYLEVLGYGHGARWVYDQAAGGARYTAGPLITVTETRRVHQLVMGPVWEVAPHPDAGPDEAPGGYRRHDIRPFTAGMTPPPWTEVPAAVTGWVDDVCAATGPGVDPDGLPVRLAVAHSHFERIHPFLDGNGRTGRLLLNLVLVRLGFPPAIVFKRDRDRYLTALDRADHDQPGPLAEILARSVIDNLHRFVVPAIAGPGRLVPLPALATPDLTYQALRQAARRGRLDAHQASDGTWRSTRTAVDVYRRQRHQRRPKIGAAQLPPDSTRRAR